MRSPEAQVVKNSIRTLLAQNRIADAIAAIDTLMQSNPPPPELVLWRAQLLLSAGRLADAITAFRTAISVAPRSGTAELGLAVALGESGQSDAAVVAARSAIAKGADSPGARFVLGRALFGSNRYDAAEAEFRRAIRFDPTHVAAHTNLAELVWMRTGDFRAATNGIDVALRATPGHLELRLLKAKLLEASGQTNEVYPELAEGIRHRATSVELHVAASQAALKFDAACALAHAETAVRTAPASVDAISAYADALLTSGHAERVVAVTDKLLAVNPDDGHAIAVRASAWRMLGDPRYRALYDYQNFVKPSKIDTPAGWQNLTSYLCDLAQALSRLHEALRAQPLMQTLRSGTQIELRLEQSQDPAIRAFTQAIDGPIRRYMESIGMGEDLLRRRNTGTYKLSGIWSVRLRPNGYHVNHFHGKGWLSSACHIHVPDALGIEGKEGWLTFGEPGIPTKPHLTPEHFVRPEPGVLVLFPSWMWHGTVPFSGTPTDSRLTIAFDVVSI